MSESTPYIHGISAMARYMGLSWSTMETAIQTDHELQSLVRVKIGPPPRRLRKYSARREDLDRWFASMPTVEEAR